MTLCSSLGLLLTLPLWPAHCCCALLQAFEEVVLDQQIASEKLWRNRTDIDVRRGILRDPDTQVIISMR